ncbi:hypothetical protein [Streptomyces sp. NPDC093223]|uniref:hypothetical protein n=1 Tax=Streptomyces sp. NPDC093223 TaxID=3366033 RepID=UPI0037F6DF7D
MRYIIAHGELTTGRFNAGPTQVGFFVRRLGQLLPKSEAAPFVVGRRLPILWENAEDCQDMRLSPLSPTERSAMQAAIAGERPDVLFVERSTTLRELVGFLGEDELRMIACTGAEGASRTAGREVVAGITVEHLGVESSRTSISTMVDHHVNQFLLTRKRNAAAAWAYVDRLDEDVRGSMWVHPSTSALMLEREIARLEPVTDQLGSWVALLHWVNAHRVSAELLFQGRAQFPGFGEDLRARIEAVNAQAMAWPYSARLFGEAWSDNPAWEAIKYYLHDRPLGAPGLAALTQRFVSEYLPLRDMVHALRPDDLDTWDAFLRRLAELPSQEDRAAVDGVVNVEDCLRWMADISVRSDDFDMLWQHILSVYPTTVGAALTEQGATDPELRRLIERYDADYRPPAVGVMDADGMEIDTDRIDPTMTATAGAETELPCPRCRYVTVHQVGEADVWTGSQAALCPVCHRPAQDDEPGVPYVCRACGDFTRVHTTCH